MIGRWVVEQWKDPYENPKSEGWSESERPPKGMEKKYEKKMGEVKTEKKDFFSTSRMWLLVSTAAKK